METTAKVVNIIGVVYGILVILGSLASPVPEDIVYGVIGGLMFIGLASVNLVNKR